MLLLLLSVLTQIQPITSHLGVQDLLRGSSFLLSLWARWVLLIKQSMQSHTSIGNPLGLHYAMVKDSALHCNLGLTSPSAFDFVFWHFPSAHWSQWFPLDEMLCSLILLISHTSATLPSAPDLHVISSLPCILCRTQSLLLKSAWFTGIASPSVSGMVFLTVYWFTVFP